MAHVLLALTHWGMFRYYWIIVKEVLTLLSVGISVIGFYVWSVKGLSIISVEGLSAQQDPGFRVVTIQLWIGIVVQMTSLVSMTAISVFKPWGRRKLTSQE